MLSNAAVSSRQIANRRWSERRRGRITEDVALHTGSTPPSKIEHVCVGFQTESHFPQLHAMAAEYAQLQPSCVRLPCRNTERAECCLRGGRSPGTASPERSVSPPDCRRPPRLVSDPGQLDALLELGHSVRRHVLDITALRVYRQIIWRLDSLVATLLCPQKCTLDIAGAC